LQTITKLSTSSIAAGLGTAKTLLRAADVINVVMEDVIIACQNLGARKSNIKIKEKITSASPNCVILPWPLKSITRAVGWETITYGSVRGSG